MANIIYKAQDEFGETEARIAVLVSGKFEGQFSVAVIDLESGESFGFAKIYKTFEEAKTKADEIKG